EASAAAVSENIVVGTGVKPGEVERGSYLYYDGETRELEAPEGQRAEVFDINSEGESVGHGSGGSALRWSLDAEDEPRELSSPHGQAQALSIDDTGTVGGSAEGDDGGTVPVIWDSDGEYRQLPVLDGAEHSMVSSISGDFAIGTSGASPDDSPDVLWNVADNTVTRFLSQLRSTTSTTRAPLRPLPRTAPQLSSTAKKSLNCRIWPPARPRPRRSPNRGRWPEPAATQQAIGMRPSGPAAEERPEGTSRIRPLTFPPRQPIRSNHDRQKGSSSMGKRRIQSPMSAAEKREQWGEFADREHELLDEVEARW